MIDDEECKYIPTSPDHPYIMGGLVQVAIKQATSKSMELYDLYVSWGKEGLIEVPPNLSLPTITAVGRDIEVLYENETEYLEILFIGVSIEYTLVSKRCIYSQGKILDPYGVSMALKLLTMGSIGRIDHLTNKSMCYILDNYSCKIGYLSELQTYYRVISNHCLNNYNYSSPSILIDKETTSITLTWRYFTRLLSICLYPYGNTRYVYQNSRSQSDNKNIEGTTLSEETLRELLDKLIGV